MELAADRLAFLLRVFREGPGLTLDALAEEAGVARSILIPPDPARRVVGYDKERSPETIAKIGVAASRLLHLENHWQLPKWLAEGGDDALHAFLCDQLGLAECTKCHSRLPKDEIDKVSRRCDTCDKEDLRAKGFRRRLAEKPKLREYYEALKAAMPTIRKKDPDLHAALRKLDGESITRPKIAKELLRQEAEARGEAVEITKAQVAAKVPEVLRRWVAAGLAATLLKLIAAGGGAQVRPVEPLQPGHISAKMGPGRRRRGDKGKAQEAQPSTGKGPPKKRKPPPRRPGEAARGGKVSPARRAPLGQGLAGGRRQGTVTGPFVLLEQGGDQP